MQALANIALCVMLGALSLGSTARAVDPFEASDASATRLAEWWVDASAPGPGTGAQADPFPSIQTAIAAAASGDVIRVLPGTYAENVDFIGKDLLVQSEGGAGVTTIAGTGNGPVVTFVTGEGSGAVLRGFTVQGGGFGAGVERGGGIHCDAANPLIEQSVIAANTNGTSSTPNILSPPTEYRGGGGITLVGVSSAVVRDCQISGNTYVSGGVDVGAGGVWVDGTAAIEDCEITGNQGAGDGPSSAGGIHVRNGSTAILRCLINANLGAPGILSVSPFVQISDATNAGTGGLHVAAGSGVTVTGSRIVDNSGGQGEDGLDVLQPALGAQSNGGRGSDGGCGGISVASNASAAIVNCLIARNAGGDAGDGGQGGPGGSFATAGVGGDGGDGGSGGLSLAGGTDVVCCTITGNGRGDAGSPGLGGAAVGGFPGGPDGSAGLPGEGGVLVRGASVRIDDSILWNDTPGEISLAAGGAVAVSFSDVQGGFAGSGNLDADPLFVDLVEYRLTNASPGIDRGNPNLALVPPTDFEGDPRVYGLGLDLGYDERATFVLTGTSTGGGVGDLFLDVDGIPPGASNVLLVGSHTPALLGLGTGSILGIAPDPVTWVLIFSNPTPFNPFHFPVTANPYATGPFTLPSGALSGLAGTTVEATLLAYGPLSPQVRQSNFVTWTY